MAAARRRTSSEAAGTAGTLRNKVGIWLGLLLFAAIWFGPELDPDQPAVSDMMAIAVLMATWWVTEAIPIPATALVPIVLFPLTGIMKGEEVARIGFHPLFLCPALLSLWCSNHLHGLP